MNYINLDENLDPEIMALSRHEHNHELFVAIRDTAFQIIKERMHPSFPEYLIDHSLQVANQTKKLLIDQGVDVGVAQIIGENASLHDIGKAHLTQIPHWIYTTEKPEKGPQFEFRKQEQKRHPFLGPEVLKEILDRLDVNFQDLRKEERMRLRVCEYIMTHHHDLTNPNMGMVLDIVRTVDMAAGLLKTTNHDYGSAIRKIYSEPDKYARQYNPALMQRLAIINGVNDAIAPERVLAI